LISEAHPTLSSNQIMNKVKQIKSSIDKYSDGDEGFLMNIGEGTGKKAVTIGGKRYNSLSEYLTTIDIVKNKDNVFSRVPGTEVKTSINKEGNIFTSTNALGNFVNQSGTPLLDGRIAYKYQLPTSNKIIDVIYDNNLLGINIK